MRALLLNFYQGPENFHMEQAFIRAASKIKGLELDVLHNFTEDFSPLKTGDACANKRIFFSDFKQLKKERYDLIISVDFPWKKDKSCLAYAEAVNSGGKKILIANHLLPQDEHAPFFAGLKKNNFFSLFDSAYFYAFDHPSNFPVLKKDAVKYRTYHIDTSFYNPKTSKRTDKETNKINIFIAGSKERAFSAVNSTLRLVKSAHITLISNSDFSPAKKYADRFKLLKLNENVLKMRQVLSSCDLVLVPLKNAGKNQTAGMAIAFMGMSMQKPVIIKSRRWIRDYISHEKNGFFYQSSSKIAEAVKKAVENKNIWRKIGATARKTMLKKASLDSFALKILRQNLLK